MKNKGINYILLLIMAVGITITTCTNYFLKSASKTGTTTNMAFDAEMMEEERTLLEELPDRMETEGRSRLAEKGKGTDGFGQEEGIGQGQRSSGAEEEDSFGTGSVNSEIATVKDNGAKDEDSEEEFFGEVVVSENLKSQGENAEITPISPLETTAARGDSPGNTEKRVLIEEAAKASYYRNRLADLEAQIQKNRESQNTSNTSSSAKNMASNELKLWDNELNAIYDEILEHLDEEQAQILVRQEREWMKERDRIAMEVARDLAGASRESVEYTASQAESTRLRAYELVETYEYLLVD